MSQLHPAMGRVGVWGCSVLVVFYGILLAMALLIVLPGCVVQPPTPRIQPAPVPVPIPYPVPQPCPGPGPCSVPRPPHQFVVM